MSGLDVMDGLTARERAVIYRDLVKGGTELTEEEREDFGRALADWGTDEPPTALDLYDRTTLTGEKVADLEYLELLRRMAKRVERLEMIVAVIGGVAGSD